MDINKKRLGALKTAATAQGVQGLITTHASDLCKHAAWVAQQSDADKQQHQHDKVLVDAPCSGLGVLAKRYAAWNVQWNPNVPFPFLPPFVCRNCYLYLYICVIICKPKNSTSAVLTAAARTDD